MRVAHADDSALFRSGLAMLLDAAGVEVILQTKTGDELLARMAPDPPDVAILDIRMPPTFTDEGLVTAVRIHERFPGVGVLVLSTYAETTYAVTLLQNSLEPSGYLLKDRVDDIGTLLDALERVAAGEPVVDSEIVRRLMGRRTNADTLARLAEREVAVLELMAQGRSNAGIARKLYISPKTVEKHIANIFSSLDLAGTSDDNRRVLAVLTWLRRWEQPAARAT